LSAQARPGVGFTDTTDFLFDKRGELANQNLLPLFRTPDKVRSSFVGDTFGVLRIHTLHYNKGSLFPEVPRWAALPLDAS
jgi:hypothetical protein